MEAENRITARVWVELDDIIDGDIERFDDLLAEGAGDPSLTDIGYKIVGHRVGSILVEVDGMLSEDDEDDDGGNDE